MTGWNGQAGGRPLQGSVAHPVRAAGRNGATSTRPACHQRHAPQHLAREEEAARRARLALLATRSEQVWDEIEREIERRNSPGYDVVAGLIMDMQTLALDHGIDDEFVYRLEAIRERRARKPRFIERLASL